MSTQPDLPPPDDEVRREGALALLRHLRASDYRFTAVTPATHARVLARPAPARPSLRDIFGWNRSFAPDDLPPGLLATLRNAELVEQTVDGLRSRLRVATLENLSFVHSAYPTTAPDSVFFGPDTYRFIRFVEQHAPALRPRRILDMGTGCGAGGIVAARLFPDSDTVLADVNEGALQLASVNAEAAGVSVGMASTDRVLSGFDLIIANPPYIADSGARTYRNGGGLIGGALSLDWARHALNALTPGGTLLLYTGAAFVGGRAPLLDALAPLGRNLTVDELDPDVFGEQLDEESYESVERIAAVGIVLRRL
ncbi:class I SAM-dependent methyltransferase [Sphingomonas ginkgonis]|uniref:Class I SAM-dependent methyltransferase n=2 Tax=Sphingomonas ginkgonis TaxID=2315330 RepID=A0A3S0EPN0_9SPHN|nr:class I SAM-dependent methyltransferase [Sphingomonas ginkgonis]